MYCNQNNVFIFLLKAVSKEGKKHNLLTVIQRHMVNNHSGSERGNPLQCSAFIDVGRIDPSWGEPTDLFLVPASAPRLV